MGGHNLINSRVKKFFSYYRPYKRLLFADLACAFIVSAVVGIAGRRRQISRNPPMYVFPDMRYQLKLRPQTPNGFFANGLSSQLAVTGTIARGKPVLTAAGQVSVAVENARLFERVKEEADTLLLLSEVGRETSAILDVEELLRRAAEQT